MRFSTGRSRLLFVSVAVIAATALSVGASVPSIEMKSAGDRVTWTVSADYEAATLALAIPDGTVIERVFSAREAISFSPSDLDDISVIDGSYQWQIVLTPVLGPAVREKMEAARAAGDSTVVATLVTRGEIPPENELVHSGTFRVVNRTLVNGGNTEPQIEEAQTKGSSEVVDLDQQPESQVIATDLIVQGSECVGFDCVNGESFGFDTLRLKENNLRIHFMDTSNSASFPTNDWRIVANDTSNGGSNYLAIEDSNAATQVFRVDAGAGANALRVDAQGDVGIGTATPVVELQIADGDSPTLRLEQNGSSGFTPQTWDLAGNETNFFVRDVTNASKLPFRIRPGAPTNSIFIDTDGDVGLGTASPDAKLNVVAATGGGAVDSIHLENSGPARIKITNTAITNSGTVDQDWTLNSNGTLRISAGGDAPELTLDAAGNLTVSGSYKVNAVTLNVPDFVFEEGYSLMPLDDLDAFVKTNHHLPGIPSAKEVNSDVLDMTQMQLQLLQKIEELTLYTLQQQATIDKLYGRIETLEGGKN